MGSKSITLAAVFAPVRQCHCIVRQGVETIPEMTDTEEEELSFAPGLTPNSRLSCQSVPDGTSDLVVQIPNWNRNAVREGH